MTFLEYAKYLRDHDWPWDDRNQKTAIEIAPILEKKAPIYRSINPFEEKA